MDNKTKKDFQKVIKTIRRDREYPKAMMTGLQMRHNTATVNCGGEWKPAGYTRELAEEVMEDKLFQEFLSKWEAEAEIELNSAKSWQIRIYF